ncbi:glycosyltransferase family 2 protein [Paenibacillus alvei]|uniref:glycosyltransferase family 2 protein n=1 Tax=Paenibacillus alvei TaxID=44250 RepID=UPI000385D695|nr:glycosyltransferase [Paenibacillus alvei]EPY13413.1 hypothetical protein PAAL66ix_07871 [Paenibacillus alvei A6-6i-x]
MFNENRYRASVIIPTYNRGELLRSTLQSLLTQSIDKNEFEVIVIDDGSSDHTKEVVISFENEMNLKYVYQYDKGFRVARARNLGVSLCEAPICIFIDSGLLLSPDCLYHHIHPHESATQPLAVIGYVAGFSQNDHNNESIKQALQTADRHQMFTALINRSDFNDIREACYLKYNDEIGKLPAPWVLFWAGNVSVSTAMVNKVKGFDENYMSWGVEDVDFGYALHLQGAEFRLCREALSIHFPHEKDELDHRRTSHDNRLYFHHKYQSRETELLISTRCLDMNDLLLNLNCPTTE